MSVALGLGVRLGLRGGGGGLPWTIGLTSTPPYVPNWTRPLTLAAGIANGTIPADAIDYSTGNGGGAFADLYAWITACNAANKPGALGVDLTITTAAASLARTYLYRGIYGYGAANPKIIWTGRASSSASQRGLFFTYLEDVTIRGVEFEDWSCVLAVGQKTLPLIDTSTVTCTGSITSDVLTLTVATAGGTLGVNCQIGSAIFAATISGTVMTVTTFSGGAGSGALGVGTQIFGPGITAGTSISSLGTGSGGTGTYNINNSHTITTAVTLQSGLGTDDRARITAILSGSGGIGSTYQLTTTPNRGATAVAAGQIDAQPYHTSTQPLTYIADPTALGFGLFCPRVGRIVTTGSFNVSAIAVKRQIENLTPMGQGSGGGGGSANPGNNNYYFSDTAWTSVLETVDLFTGASATTNAAIVSAINANTTVGLAHGYAAVLALDGSVLVTANTVNTKSFVEMVITQTGTPATYDVKTPGVSITHCTFTDCNIGYAALLDVAELGPVEFHKNSCPGTWSGVYAQVTRWGHFRAANNEWYDCLLSRGGQVGRPATGAMCPSGSSQTEFNTFFYMGTDSAVHMRYHVNGTTYLVENNYAHDVNSANVTDAVNCAVFSDVRNCWQRTSNNRICRIGYNQIISVNGRTTAGFVSGAEDSNAFYMKPRGITVVANYIENCGTGWASTTLDGSECTGILAKNPGPWNRQYTSSYGTNENSEVLNVFGNSLVDQPAGRPMLKLDEVYGNLVVQDNLMQNWVNYAGAAEVTGSITGNVLNVTAVASGRVNVGQLLKGAGIPTAQVIGTISGTVMTVSSVVSGTLAVGMSITSGSISANAITISSFGTGSGGVGTYNLSASATFGTASIINAGCAIASLGTGTGGTGTYNVTTTPNVGSTTIGLGIEGIRGTSSGGMRFTGGQNTVYVRRNRYSQCDPGTTDTSMLTNYHNLNSWDNTQFVPADFFLDNNEIQNNGATHPNGTFPIYGANTPLVRFNFGSNTPAAGFTGASGITTGFNRILTALGVDSGFRMQASATSPLETGLGTNNAPSQPYGSVNYLAGYGAGL